MKRKVANILLTSSAFMIAYGLAIVCQEGLRKIDMDSEKTGIVLRPKEQDEYNIRDYDRTPFGLGLVIGGGSLAYMSKALREDN